MEELKSTDWSVTNQHGLIECRLCGIDHKNLESYQNHINGRRHFYRLQFLLNRKTKAQTEPKWKTNTNPSSKENHSSPKASGTSAKTSKDRLEDNFDIETLQLYDEQLNKLKICVLAKWFIFNDNEQIEFSKPEFSFIGSYEQTVEKKEVDKMYLILKMKGYTNVAVKFDKYKIDLENVYYDWDEINMELLFCFDLILNK
eukprot:GAHX01001515.1.p1 GENE.GAHX01001515.1~~GAHX01001515.1.p1  ORF type:complete len:200 (+),score=39.43 GAHX01001515.1:522-1121(+)